jgi:hypothetical protein
MNAGFFKFEKKTQKISEKLKQVSDKVYDNQEE